MKQKSIAIIQNIQRRKEPLKSESKGKWDDKGNLLKLKGWKYIK